MLERQTQTDKPSGAGIATLEDPENGVIYDIVFAWSDVYYLHFCDYLGFYDY